MQPVKTMNGTEVSSTEMEAVKGLTFYLTMWLSLKKEKAKFLSKKQNETREAKNGKTYLPKGKYIVEISGNGATENIEFEIE